MQNPLHKYVLEHRVPLHRLSVELGVAYQTIRRFTEVDPTLSLLNMKIGNVLLIKEKTGVDMMPYIEELYAAKGNGSSLPKV